MLLILLLLGCDDVEQVPCRDAQTDPTACKCAHPTWDDGGCWSPFEPDPDVCEELFGTETEQKEACGQ
jgi:hypothetical protein